MSSVADVFVLAPTSAFEDTDLLDQINAFFPEGRPGLREIPQAVIGGGKAMQASVAAGAFNYLDIPAFIAHCRRIDWKRLEPWGYVQLLLKDENDAGFGLVEVYRVPDSDPAFDAARYAPEEGP